MMEGIDGPLEEIGGPLEDIGGPLEDYLQIVLPSDDDVEYEYVDEFELHATARRENTRRPMTATAVNKYRFDRRLGGMAYLAKENSIRQEWRIIRRLKLTDWQIVKIDELKEELKSRNETLKHHHLLQMVDLFEIDKTIYIVTEYCEGGTLGALVSRAKHYGEYLQEIEVLDWLVQMLRATQHLNEKGLVHGLIATGNVMLRKNAIKLGETKQGKEFLKKLELFRLVYNKKTEGPCAHSMNEGRVTAAELRYYSPEVVRGQDFTHKADVWSIGCVLYELCSQKRIFNSKKTEEVAEFITEGDLPEFPAYFSLDLANLWRRIMVRDVKQRPTAQQIMDMDFIKEHIEDMEATPQYCDNSELHTIQEDS